MANCTSFTCPSRCVGYWSGCRTYSCIDKAPVSPVANRYTIVDNNGICTHVVTRIHQHSSAWNSSGNTANRQYYEVSVPANTGQDVYNDHIIDLRDAINEERHRRRYSGVAAYAGLTKENFVQNVTGNTISAAIGELSSAINDIQAGSSNVYPNFGDLVDGEHIDRIRKSIETLRKSCICDTDCGSNTTCACYCDCGCNYSDIRLKRNIRDI